MGNHVVFRSPSLTVPGGQATPQGFVDNLLEGKVQEPGPLAKGAGYVIVQSKCRSHNSILMPTIFDVKTGTVSSGPCGRIDASDNCRYPAFEEASTLLSNLAQTPDVTASRGDQVRQSARARNTWKAYHGHWNRFRSWAQEQGLDLPDGLEDALGDYLVHLAEQGRRMATIRQARAAIVKGAELTGWPRPDTPRVAETMGGLARLLPGPQQQAAPLSAEVLAAVRATALAPRRTRGGHTETTEYARCRGLVDVGPWPPSCGTGCCGSPRPPHGSGRIRVAESKTDQEGEGTFLYLGPAAVEALLAIHPEGNMAGGSTPVFGLHPDTIRRRLLQAARAAGLPGWQDITGHSGRVGMAQDLSAAGFGLPELMTAGRWKSPRMPARYTERPAAGRGAVARYYQGSRGIGDQHLTVGGAPIASGGNSGAGSSDGRDADLASHRRSWAQ